MSAMTKTTHHNKTRVGRALGKAVEAIYFNDSSDYLRALWEIVRELGGQEAVDLLESDEHKAFERYVKE
jgi:hypothetical protein